jgi:hypothetical protein
MAGNFRVQRTKFKVGKAKNPPEKNPAGWIKRPFSVQR